MIETIQERATMPGSNAMPEFDAKAVSSLEQWIKNGNKLTPQQSALLGRIYDKVLAR